MKIQNYTKTGLLQFFSSRHFACRFSFAVEPTKSRPLRFGKIEKMVTVLIIVGILVVSAFGFLMQAGEPYSSPDTPDTPVKNTSTATPSPSASPSPTEDTSIASVIQQKITHSGSEVPQVDSRGIFERSSAMNSTAWHQVAVCAWNFFEPERGIDSTTGLPAGSWGWNYFTDWDLGVYIQAVLDAQELGLTSPDAYWGSSIRLEKVMQFLETRPLLTNVTTMPPYWFYDSAGGGYMTQDRFDVVDTGTLFVSLYNLKMYNSSLADRIDNFVYNTVKNQEGNRTDYASIVPAIKAEDETSTSIYGYYMTAGFAKFFPELNTYAEKVLDNILNAPTTQTPENVTLPKSTLTCEPLLYSYFYLNNNPKLNTILDQVYAAHEAKYESTGEYVAFSEGNDKSNDGFIYEWVVLPNGDTWKITRLGSSEYVEDMKPIIYTRVAVSFLAIYNSTFAKDMCVYIEKVSRSPDNGFFTGAVYDPVPQIDTSLGHVGCNTNGLILAAARHASR